MTHRTMSERSYHGATSLSCPGQRNRYNSLLWMRTLNTLTWPDLTWPVCDDLHSLVPRGWSWCRSSRWYSPPSPRCAPSTPSCAAVWGPAKPAGSLKQTKGIVLINDALNTFYLLCGIRHVVKDHSDSERGHPLLPHGLLFLISSKGSVICIIHRQDNTYYGLCYTRQMRGRKDMFYLTTHSTHFIYYVA